MLAQLRPGDEVAAAADLYGGTFRLLERVYKPWGVVPKYTDDPSLKGFASILSAKTKLVWIESPTNPLLQIVDIAALADMAHKAGALLAVDNTFASPYLQQPLALGADYVVHSTTKYLGGHSDVVGGAIIGKADLLKPVRFYQNAAGGTPGPFDSWLVLRGIKTLAVRMERHCANARHLAEWLSHHPAVQKVYYPGLKSDPGHELAKKQMRDFGGMISIRVRGGKETRHSEAPDGAPNSSASRESLGERRIADRPPGDHDTRQHPARRASTGTLHRRRPGPFERRHRGCRGFAGGFAGGSLIGVL